MREIDVDDAERIADESERATMIEMAANEEAIKRALRKVEHAPTDFDGVHCTDCESEIPDARLRTKAFRCIDCQTSFEKKSRNHRSYYEP